MHLYANQKPLVDCSSMQTAACVRVWNASVTNGMKRSCHHYTDSFARFAIPTRELIAAMPQVSWTVAFRKFKTNHNISRHKTFEGIALQWQSNPLSTCPWTSKPAATHPPLKALLRHNAAPRFLQSRHEKCICWILLVVSKGAQNKAALALSRMSSFKCVHIHSAC